MGADKVGLIIDEITNLLKRKEVSPTEKLPSENELALRFDVPRLTVREAFKQLELRGQIYAIKGKGRFVRPPSTLIDLHLNGKESFTEKMERAGHFIQTNNWYVAICMDERIRDELNCPRAQDVYEIARVREINGEAMAIHRSYVGEHIFPEISIDASKISSMFAYYREHGYTEFGSTRSYLSVVYPTRKEEEILNVSSMIPLLLLESNTIDLQTGQLLEYTEIRYRSDKFIYNLSGENG